MNRKPSKLTPLIAARIHTNRRRPAQQPSSSEPPVLRLTEERNESDPTDSRAPAGCATPEQIHALLTRLQQVTATADINECRNVAELRLLQECIDKTVDAISAITAGVAAEQRKRLIIAGMADLSLLRTGGRSSLAKTTVAAVRKTIDGVVGRLESSMGWNRPVSVDDLLAGKVGRQIACENLHACTSVADDADFALQISQLTQLDVLSHTRGVFSRRPANNAPPLVDMDPNS